MREMSLVRMATLAIGVVSGSCLMAQDNEERQEPRGPGGDDLGATTDGFLLEDGGAIYQGACAGCHQPQGEGAMGAAAYPALSGNARLEGGQYPAWILINGMGAMPAFNDWLTDDQIVEVVTYIQQNFGNDFTNHPTADTVAELRETANENAPDNESGEED